MGEGSLGIGVTCEMVHLGGRSLGRGCRFPKCPLSQVAVRNFRDQVLNFQIFTKILLLIAHFANNDGAAHRLDKVLKSTKRSERLEA